MAEHNQEGEKTVDVFSSLLSLSIENNALLEVLLRVAGELQAVHRKKEGDEIDKHISGLFDQVRERQASILASLAK